MGEETKPCLGCKKEIPTDDPETCHECFLTMSKVVDLMKALADSLGVKPKSRAPTVEPPKETP